MVRVRPRLRQLLLRGLSSCRGRAFGVLSGFGFVGFDDFMGDALRNIRDVLFAGGDAVGSRFGPPNVSSS